jgi:hypothetical protein
VPIEKKKSIRWLENLRQPTELLSDPGCCVHIGDRESDIYELFSLAQHLGTHFLVRPLRRPAGRRWRTYGSRCDETGSSSGTASCSGAEQARGIFYCSS